jgi:hypothetical protein
MVNIFLLLKPGQNFPSFAHPKYENGGSDSACGCYNSEEGQYLSQPWNLFVIHIGKHNRKLLTLIACIFSVLLEITCSEQGESRRSK